VSEDPIQQMKLEFVANASETVEKLSRRLAALERGEPYPRQLVDSIFRTAHSLRGTAGMFGLDEVSVLAGALENLLEALRAERLAGTPDVADLVVEVLDHLPVLLRNENDEEAKSAGRSLGETIGTLVVSRVGPKSGQPGLKDGESTEPPQSPGPQHPEGDPLTAHPAATGVRRPSEVAAAPPLSVKVDIGVLDAIMNTVSELFSTQLALSGIAKRLPRNSDTRRLGDDLLKTSYLLNKRMLDLEASVVEARLVPMAMLFVRYSGEVRRLAKQAGKAIDLVFDGEATRIDRALLDNLYDPLLHVIRNAVDHGVEPPEERAGLGKPARGKIVLRARQESSHVRIDVEDDGRGVDLARVTEVALTRGMSVDDRKGALDIIFEPGFSTKDRPSDISGRGVGLDAVRTQIEALRGMVNLATEPGRGTAVSIWVPLTLAVSRGMLVEEGGVPVAIPLGCIVEVLRATEALRSEVASTGGIQYHGWALPVLVLAEMLGITGSSEPRFIVILGIGDRRRAILVERVLGETEIVSRPLPEAMTAPGFISGATELHNGRPAIVIQPTEVLRAQVDDHSRRVDSFAPASLAGLADKGAGSARLVVVRQGDDRYALPLGCLKEMLPESQVIEVPALGEVWEGIFFVRGLCHGLLRLPGDDPAGRTSRMKTIILTFPERCGIRVDGAVGDCEVPLEAISPVDRGGRRGFIRIVGTFEWMGREVRLLAVPSATGDGPAQAPPARMDLAQG
jgi:two-component system chemotaxis sensor kinase CheA